MSTITVKSIPPSLHKALKARATAHGRSLNREIIATLESSLHSVRIDAAGIASHARAVRETTGVYLTQRDLAAFREAGRR